MTHTDVGHATIDAPPERVFAALVDQSARTAWLPPRGMSGRFSWFDARPGGGYRLTLSYDDPSTPGKSGGNQDVVTVRFEVIDPPHRIVELAEFASGDPDLAGAMTMTWSLEPAGHRTRVTITAADVPDSIASSDHVAAFASTLANLNAYLSDPRLQEPDAT